MRNLQIKDAKDLYDLTEKFREVGTKDYRYRCHYDLIRENMKEGYVHKELGTYYGWSAAYAALHGATQLHLVDVDFKPFNTHKKYFDEYLKTKNGNLYLYNCSSHDSKCVGPCDTMLIDSVHTWKWVKKELEMHAHTVKDWIVFHDTAMIHGEPSPIGPGIKDWLKTNIIGSQFELAEELTEGVGAMMIKRIS
ncbi:class I SAM-dependent methyltransferase [bacterium]|nr:class I SAM-dependent methyltransferase [bacterium]